MLISRTDYRLVLDNAFKRHYSDGSDVWTNDLEMRCFPALIQGELKLKRNVQTLDIGCGAGYDTAYFSSVFESATGVDIVEHPHWKEICLQQPNVFFVNESFEEFTTLARYDVILDNGCFHHQHPEMRIPYFEKVRLLLKEDACFALSTFKNDSIDEFWDANGRLHKYFKDDELKKILDQAGFETFKEMDIFRKHKNDYYRLSLCKVI